MANAIYPKALEAFLGGDLDWDADTFNVVMLDVADYTYSAAHEFLDDVPSGARVGTPQTLASKTKTDGVADAADATFPAVTGDPCEALLIYQDSGVEGTSRLVAYIDSVTGMPVTPSGADITVRWSSGANRIFKL